MRFSAVVFRMVLAGDEVGDLQMNLKEKMVAPLLQRNSQPSEASNGFVCHEAGADMSLGVLP